MTRRVPAVGTCGRGLRPEELLERSTGRLVAAARELADKLIGTPGALERLMADDPHTWAALLPLLDAAVEYEGHAEVVRNG
jgi:hypothetical protein